MLIVRISIIVYFAHRSGGEKLVANKRRQDRCRDADCQADIDVQHDYSEKGNYPGKLNTHTHT